MKLITFIQNGRHRIGEVVDDMVYVTAWTDPMTSLIRRGITPSRTYERFPLASVNIDAPLTPGKIIAIGRNYSEHAKEVGGTLPTEPLIQSITSRIMGDESRHVAFGVLSLEQLYTQEMSSRELAEREEFVMDATTMMHDRLLHTPVFERLGMDVKAWTTWTEENDLQRGFRQLTFTKVVPNLKRLGLLTPRVRAHLERLNLLRFENEKDSVEDAEVRPSPELINLVMSGLAARASA